MELLKFIIFMDALMLVIFAVINIFLPLDLITVLKVLGISTLAMLLAPGIDLLFEWWMDS